MLTGLTVLGCSGSVPGAESASSGYLVQRDGFNMLLDLGSGAVGPLQRYVAAERVDAVFFSHAHADHVGDAWGLLYLRGRVDGTGVLPVFGPGNLVDVIGARGPVDDFVSFEPMPETIGPWRVRAAIGVHHVENWIIRLDDSLCYTGDTEPCPALDELAFGCAVLLAEAAGFDAERPPGHLSAGDAGRLAQRSGAGLLVLTHLRPWHDQPALLEEASGECDCPVVLAATGLRLSLPAGSSPSHRDPRPDLGFLAT